MFDMARKILQFNAIKLFTLKTFRANISTNVAYLSKEHLLLYSSIVLIYC